MESNRRIFISKLIAIIADNNNEKQILNNFGVPFGKIILVAKKNAVILKNTYIMLI